MGCGSPNTQKNEGVKKNNLVKKTKVNYYAQGLAKLKDGNIQGAIDNLNYHIGQNPENCHAYFILANIYMEAKNYQLAKITLTKATALKAPSPDIYYLLAQTHEKLDEIDQAIEAIKKSIEIYKENKNKKNYHQARTILKILLKKSVKKLAPTN